MTNITFRTRYGHIYQVTSENHTSYDSPGYDIVCSAISALMITTANGLTSVARIPDVEIKTDPASGYMFIGVPRIGMEPRDQIKSDLLLETLEKGLMAVEEGYFENVDIQWIADDQE
ncbi:MAG: ribosomal-processing cysteine protease Prp [Eubacteriaceae bacterium]|jgi:uncharacterized protein YsxB (DUF464 family)